MQADIDSIKRSRLFQDLPETSIAQLAMRVSRRHVPAGQRLFRAGDTGSAFFVIQDGDVTISMPSPTGQEITLALLGPGDSFGELALLDEEPRSATATVTRDAQLLTLQRDDFLDVIQHEPAALTAFLSNLAGVVRNMNQRLADVATLNAQHRLARVFNDLLERDGRAVEDGILIDRPLSSADLGGLAGLHPVQVERLLRDLEYDSVVGRRDDLWVVFRPEVLQAAG